MLRGAHGSLGSPWLQWAGRNTEGLYLHCYPWDQGGRWGPEVRRGLGHQGSQEHQQYRERPVGDRSGETLGAESGGV